MQLSTHVDGFGFSLDDGDLPRLVPRQIPRGLQNRPWTDSAHGDTGQERGEEKVVLGADDDDIVFCGVEGLEEACCAPPAAEDDDGLFGVVKGELCAWIAVLLGDVVEGAGCCYEGDEGDATEDLEEGAVF